MLKTGKLPEAVLIRSVLKQIGHRRSEVLCGPGVGVDCAALQVAEDEALVMSADPITGTVKDIGRHAIHVTANDLAASGAEPLGVMLTVLLPEEMTEEELRSIMRDAENACTELDMEILGGHTEVTDAVSQPLVSVAGVGKIKRNGFLDPSAVHPGQDVLVTKWIGLEATAILAKEKEALLLKRFSADFLRDAKQFDKYLSVVKDARIAAENKVTAMHDITEGGVFGALWEVAEAGHVGLEIDIRKIPIRQETVEICEFFGVNPYQIMSSGAMLMVTDDGQGLSRALKDAGIPAEIIGRTTEGKARVLTNQGEIRYLDRPATDELYRALKTE